MHPTPGASSGPLPVRLPVNPDADGRVDGGGGSLEGCLEQARAPRQPADKIQRITLPRARTLGGASVLTPTATCFFFVASAPPNATELLLAHTRKLTQTTGTPAVLRVRDASCMRCDRAALHSLAHASCASEVFRGAPCVLRYSGC